MFDAPHQRRESERVASLSGGGRSGHGGRRGVDGGREAAGDEAGSGGKEGVRVSVRRSASARDEEGRRPEMKLALEDGEAKARAPSSADDELERRVFRRLSWRVLPIFAGAPRRRRRRHGGCRGAEHPLRVL